VTGTLVPLKYIAGINERALGEDTDPDYRFRYVDIGTVGRGELVAEPQEMRFEDAPSRARRIVCAGDTIVSTVRTYLRAVWPLPDDEGDLVVSTGFAVLTPRDVDPRYFSWWVRSDPFIEEVVARSVGVSYPAVNASQLGELNVRLPTAGEQRAIADFLDTETARIDALMIKKRRMIELIERRWQAELRKELQSLRNETIALRHIARVKRGQSPRPIDDPVYFDDAGTHGWVRIQDASKSDVYLKETTQHLSELGRAKSVSVGPGTLLVSIAASVGQPIITAMDCCYHDGWVGLLDLQAVPEFVYLCLVLPETFGGLGQVGTQTNINSDIVGRVQIPSLPMDRQRSFVEKLFSRRDRARQIIDRLRGQVDLLQEHRQALITAAVKGELNVPGVAA
jgi:type I restriction enzyme S subunit